MIIIRGFRWIKVTFLYITFLTSASTKWTSHHMISILKYTAFTSALCLQQKAGVKEKLSGFMTSWGCCYEIFANKVFCRKHIAQVCTKSTPHIGWLWLRSWLFRQMAFHHIQMSLTRSCTQPPPPLSKGLAECIQISAHSCIPHLGLQASQFSSLSLDRSPS